MYSLQNLSPEEKDQLLMQLIQKYDGDQSGATASGSDEEQDKEMIQPLLQAVEILCQKVEELEMRVEHTEKLVIDDLFGGIQDLYNKNLKSKGIDDIRSKYADQFGPLEGDLKTLSPDEDWGEAIYNLLDSMKTTEGYNDEMGHSAVLDAAKSIADKIASIKGTMKPTEGTVEVAPIDGKGIAIEKTQVSATPVGDGADAKFLEKVKAMKSKASNKGLI